MAEGLGKYKSKWVEREREGEKEGGDLEFTVIKEKNVRGGRTK